MISKIIILFFEQIFLKVANLFFNETLFIKFSFLQKFPPNSERKSNECKGWYATKEILLSAL